MPGDEMRSGRCFIQQLVGIQQGIMEGVFINNVGDLTPFCMGGCSHRLIGLMRLEGCSHRLIGRMMVEGLHAAAVSLPLWL